MVALNDRIKLRPLVAARDGDVVYVASEESAIREICPHPEESWMPLAGEPVVARVSEKGRQKAIAQAHRSAGQRRAAQQATALGGGVMAYTTFIPSEFRVVIDKDACLQCGRCVQQCGWNVYTLGRGREAARCPITPSARPATAA